MSIPFFVNDRGFIHFPEATDLDGAHYEVCESSLATTPAIRISMQTQTAILRGLHLSSTQALNLAHQLIYLVANHYQNDEEGER